MGPAHDAPKPDAAPPRTCDGRVHHGGGKVQHHIAHTTQWPWFPTQGHGHLAKHPWCKACGKVANVGGERALDAGGIANLLARVDHRLRQDGIKLTEAHKRLVMRRLHQGATEDPFGQRRDHQIIAIATTIATYAGLTPGTIESYVRSC